MTSSCIRTGLLIAALACSALSFAATEPSKPETPPKWAGLKEQMRKDGEGLRVIHRPDGSISIDLNGRFTHTSALVKDESGKLRPQCFNNYTAMDNALKGKSRAVRPEPAENEVADK